MIGDGTSDDLAAQLSKSLRTHAARPYEERLRLAVFLMVELLESSASLGDPDGSVPKFRNDLKALAEEGGPIITLLSASLEGSAAFAFGVMGNPKSYEP